MINRRTIAHRVGAFISVARVRSITRMRDSTAQGVRPRASERDVCDYPRTIVTRASRSTGVSSFDVLASKACALLRAVMAMAVGAMLTLAGHARAAEASEDKPVIKILEAREDEGIVLANISQPKLEFTLTLYNASDQEAQQVQIALAAFRDSSLRASPTRLDGSEERKLILPRLAGHNPRSLSVSVELPDIDTYTSQLIVGDGATSVPLKIQRVAGAATLDIEDLPAARVQIPLWSKTTWSHGIQVRQAAGTPVEVELQLTHVLSKSQGEAAWGDSAVELIVPKPGAKTRVGARARETIPLELSIARAGLYEATLAAKVDEHAPKTFKLTFYARNSYVVAAGWILLGALAALLLRVILTEMRPRLALRARVAALFQQLAALKREWEKEPAAVTLIDGAILGLERQWITLRAMTGTLADSAVSQAEHKLALLNCWLEIRKWSSELGEHAPQADQALSEARSTLEAPSVTADEIDQSIKALWNLRRQVIDTTRSDIDALIVSLENRSDGYAASLRAELSALRAGLLRREISPSGVAIGLARIRLRAAVTLAKSFEHRLQAMSRPLSMDEQSWKTLVEEAQVLLRKAGSAEDARVATEFYTTAVRNFVRGAMNALVTLLTERIGAGTPRTPLYESLRERVLELLKTQRGREDHTMLESAIDAGEAFSRIEASSPQARPAIAVRKVTATDVVEEPDSVLSDLFDRFGMNISVKALQADGAHSAHRRLQRSTAIIVFALTSLLSILLGLQTLWVGNPTWGGAGSFLAAFLWGAGVSGVSFESIVALINRLKQ